MIVIELLATLFVIGCVCAGIMSALKPNHEKEQVHTQIDRANRLILRIQVTDEVMAMLPAQIRADIDKYAETYIHGGNK